jgi:hypothetical protein
MARACLSSVDFMAASIENLHMEGKQKVCAPLDYRAPQEYTAMGSSKRDPLPVESLTSASACCWMILDCLRSWYLVIRAGIDTVTALTQAGKPDALN